MGKKFTFYIEITTACNLKCPFCPSTNINNHKYMSLDSFKELVDNIKEYSQLIYFHVLGEPSLHPFLKEMFDYLENLKILFALTTNGINLKKLENFVFDYRYLNKMNLSLQCLIQMKQDLRHNYLLNLETFIKIRSDCKSNLPINLRLWNDKQVKEVVDLNNEVKNRLNSLIENNKNIITQEADEFIWPSLEHEINIVGTGCLGGKKQFAILNDGTICLCCLDYLGNTKLGNLFDNDFLDILNSKLYLDIIESFNNRKPYFELCQKCTYRNRFRKEVTYETSNRGNRKFRRD